MDKTIHADMLTAAKPGKRDLRPYGLLGAALALWFAVYFFLQRAADYFTYTILGLAPESRLGASVAFFVYDVPKVFLLLVLIIFAVGVVRSFFSPERTRSLVAGKKEFVGNVLAASLGIVTPFCTCSACPLFIGFVEAGIPLGVTFSFLIASPMINEVALVLLYGMFGWRVALLYIATGLAIAILAGWLLGRLGLERYIEDWVRERRGQGGSVSVERLDLAARLRYGLAAVRDILRKVWPWVLGGIALGAVIHGYVPTGTLAAFMGEGAWWSVPLSVLIGVPMYSNAAGMVPVVQALVEKGASIGSALAFMMAVVGLSLPEFIILRRVLKWRLLAVFIGIVALGIVAVGYLFNAIL